MTTVTLTMVIDGFLGATKEEKNHKRDFERPDSLIVYPDSEEGTEIGPRSIKVLLPKRTKKILTLNLLPFDFKEGYLPRISCKKDIYLREGIVENKDNICRIYAINTSGHDELIEINPQQIHPFEYFTPSFESDSEQEQTNPLISDAYKRIETL